MNTTIQKMRFTIAILTVMVSTLFAQEEPPVPQTPDNFRINIVSDKVGPVVGDRLNFVLELLNNGSNDVVFTVPDEPAPVETQTPSGQSAEGAPDMPVIGVARLIPLPVPPLMGNGGQAGTGLPADPPTVNEIPLRLFGNSVVPGHSTIVITMESIPLALEPMPQEPGQEPINQEEPPENIDEPTGIRPGLYLLDCQINAIDGVAEVHAEKIIGIPLLPPPPHDNGRRPNQAQQPQQDDNGRGPNR